MKRETRGLRKQVDQVETKKRKATVKSKERKEGKKRK